MCELVKGENGCFLEIAYLLGLIDRIRIELGVLAVDHLKFYVFRGFWGMVCCSDLRELGSVCINSYI